MSFQFLKFSSSNKRSSIQTKSPSNPTTPHTRLQEEYDPGNYDFSHKETAKFSHVENAPTETMDFLKTFQSPQSLNFIKSPTSPSAPQNALPQLNILNSNKSLVKVEPQFIKYRESFDEDKAVSKVLEDFSPTYPASKLTETQEKEMVRVSGTGISKLESGTVENENEHNEQTKDDVSKSGISGTSYLDSRRMFLGDEKSASARIQDKANSKPSYANCDEDVITEEENNMSLCSANDDQVQRVDLLRKQSSNATLKSQNTSGFGFLRSLNLNLDLPQPNGSETHRGAREEIRIGVVNENNNINEDVDAEVEADDGDGDRDLNDNASSDADAQHNERVITFNEQASRTVQQEAALQERERVVTAVEGASDMQKLADIDGNLYLRKTCALFIAIIGVSFSLDSMIYQNESYRGLFLVLYAFLAYIALENGIRLRSPETQSWKRKERISDALEVAAASFFLICVDLNLMHFLSFVVIAFVPLLLVTITYYSVSTAPRSTKDVRTLSRTLYTLQALLISLKLNGYLSWEWDAVFIITWIYFGFSAIYAAIIILLLFVVIFVAMLRLQTYTISNLIIRIIGLFWYSAFHDLGIFVVGKLIGATNTDESLTFIRYACYIMLTYTIVMFIPLKKFIQTFERNQDVVANNDALIQNIQPKHVLDFQVEQAPSYFVMLSSTYFLPLHQGFLSKSRERFQRMRLLRSGSSLKSGDAAQDSSTHSKVLIIQELKKDKELLDQKLEVPKKSHHLKRAGAGPRDHGHYSQRANEKSLHSENEYNSARYDPKLFVSADDINLLKDASPICKTRFAGQEEENTCYICFERGPDAVLMDCGHGGVCCDCAINMIKDKNECMECRKPVKAVYKVDKNLKMTGIVKVSELTKVVEIKLAP